MIGGSPMMVFPMEPQFVQQVPWQRQARPAAAPPASPPAVRTAPVVRAQMDEQPAPPRPLALQMPSPEQLGVGAPASAAWGKLHQRLDQLGAMCFHLDKVAAGYRVSCVLPTGQAERLHRIDVEASSEGEAIQLTLERAENWCAQNNRQASH